MHNCSAAWSNAQIKPFCNTFCQSCVAHMPALCVVQRCSLTHADREQLDNTAKVVAHTLCMWCKYRSACISCSSALDVNMMSECDDLGFGLGIAVFLDCLHVFLPNQSRSLIKMHLLYLHRYSTLPGVSPSALHWQQIERALQ